MAAQQKLTEEEVRAIAELARLDLTDEEVSLYSEQLSEILAYFEQLQQVDTSDVDPTESVLPFRSIMREDSDAQALETGVALKNAPRAEANQFKVSAVLDGDN